MYSGSMIIHTRALVGKLTVDTVILSHYTLHLQQEQQYTVGSVQPTPAVLGDMMSELIAQAVVSWLCGATRHCS